MPTKSVEFARVRFPPELLEEAARRLIEASQEYLAENPEKRFTGPAPSSMPTFTSMSIKFGQTNWTFEARDEFLAELRHPYDSARCRIGSGGAQELDARGAQIVFTDVDWDTTVDVSFPGRASVERIMAPFERDARKYQSELPAPLAPTIFIGHGGSPAWHGLSEFLHHQMGYAVEAFETLPRAGHDIEHVLRSMLDRSHFALLVMTAEDVQADGSARARQNVIHEIGLWQGRLGWDRAIVLLEDGTDDFSNLAGVQQLRFAPGNIKSVAGDVLATLKREFGV